MKRFPAWKLVSRLGVLFTITLVLFVSLTAISGTKLIVTNHYPTISYDMLVSGEKQGVLVANIDTDIDISVDISKAKFLELYENDKKFLDLENSADPAATSPYAYTFFNDDGKSVELGDAKCWIMWTRTNGIWNPLEPCNTKLFYNTVTTPTGLGVMLTFGPIQTVQKDVAILATRRKDKNRVIISVTKLPPVSAFAVFSPFEKKIPWKLSIKTIKGYVDIVDGIRISNSAIYFRTPDLRY